MLTTWTNWTTLITLTDQRFVKKMIAEFAFLTWSNIYDMIVTIIFLMIFSIIYFTGGD